MIKSIEGFRILLADGSLLYCSRSENYELFKAAIGGYGLLGLIIDVDLRVVKNKDYDLKQWVINSSEFSELFESRVKNNSQAAMFFGRFSLDKENFLKKIIFRVYQDNRQEAIDHKITNTYWS